MTMCNESALGLCPMVGWVLVLLFEFIEMRKPTHNVLSSKVMPSVHQRLCNSLCNYNNLVTA